MTAPSRGLKPGVTDLATLHPDLAAQWHPTKNGDLTPQMVTAGSDQKVWWQAECGHDWEATVSARTKRNGKPSCPLHRVIHGVTDLATLHPDLAAQWHPTKNGDLTPQMVSTGSSQKVWWQAECGHDWEATVSARTQGDGKPSCPLHRVIHGVTDLATTHPDLAAQWHPTKNGDLTPQMVSTGSDQKVWWQAECGHDWEATASNRTQRKGKPSCPLHRVIHGVTDLATLHPDLAAQWHPTKNGDLTPQMVSTGARQKVQWQAECGHDWEATASNRTRGDGKPSCPLHRVIHGVTDLATTHPDLAAQWHPTKNGDLTPQMVPARSRRKVWWQAGCGHDWDAKVSNRTNGEECPCTWRWHGPKAAFIVRDLLRDIENSTLSPAALAVLAEQYGLPLDHPIIDTALTGGAGELRELLGETGDPQDGGEGDASVDDPPESFDADQDAVIETTDATEIPIEDVPDAEDDDVPVEGGGSTQPPALPVLDTDDVVESLTRIGRNLRNSDADAVQFLVADQVATRWRDLLRVDENARSAGEDSRAATSAHVDRLVDAAQGADNAFVRAVVGEFADQYRSARDMPVPSGWSFLPTRDCEVTEPSLMQRHVAASVARNQFYGNWSGTGAGKTVSAILAARVIDAGRHGINLVLCPNAVVSTWAEAILNCYPDSQVRARTLTPAFTGTGPKWLIVNYDLLVARQDQLAIFMAENAIDFLAIDEVHYTKQRGETFRGAASTSQRRTLVEAIRAQGAKANPDMAVLAMSATPVVNDLTEAVSMISMVTGTRPELGTKATRSNVLAVHSRLVRCGFRWLPNYRMHKEVARPAVDITDLVDVLLTADRTDFDMLITATYHEEIIQACLSAKERGKGALVYSEYVQGIIAPLRRELTREGLRVGLYTGSEKTSLTPASLAKFDVLIGTASIGTGVDGLQHWADTLVFATLPWTHAAYMQVVGRIHRQGSTNQSTRIVIPTGWARTDNGPWSWTNYRWNIVRNKKTLADAVTDGTLPKRVMPGIDEIRKGGQALLDRLVNGTELTASAEPILDTELPDVDERTRAMARWGDFSQMNSRWSNSKSSTTHKRLQSDRSEWDSYHRLYRASRKHWTEVPSAYLAEHLAKQRRPQRVADLGCGEMLLADALDTTPHTVIGFDHVAVDDRVVVADIAHTQAQAESFDVCVLSLAMMGANADDYLREAHRITALNGHLFVVEPSSRVGFDRARLTEVLAQYGFDTYKVRVSGDGKFTYMFAVRSDQEPAASADSLILPWGSSDREPLAAAVAS